METPGGGALLDSDALYRYRREVGHNPSTGCLGQARTPAQAWRAVFSEALFAFAPSTLQALRAVATALPRDATAATVLAGVTRTTTNGRDPTRYGFEVDGGWSYEGVTMPSEARSVFEAGAQQIGVGAAHGDVRRHLDEALEVVADVEDSHGRRAGRQVRDALELVCASFEDMTPAVVLCAGGAFGAGGSFGAGSGASGAWVAYGPVGVDGAWGAVVPAAVVNHARALRPAGGDPAALDGDGRVLATAARLWDPVSSGPLGTARGALDAATLILGTRAPVPQPAEVDVP